MTFNITPATVLSAASNVANLVTNSGQIDIVAVLDQTTMKQVFSDARPVKAQVLESARVMEYPVETGAVLSDHKIINPTEIEILCILRSDIYSTAYQEIRNAWLNATKLAVQTRMGTYRNMIIASLPHHEDPDMFNAVPLSIRMREVIFSVPSSIAQPKTLTNYSPTNPQDALTVNRGLLSAIAAPGAVLSYFRALSIWGK